MDRELREALREAHALLFLCSGNIVRSAFAELWARHRGCRLPVTSAATVYRHLRGVHPPAARLLAARGVAPEAIEAFRSRHLDSVVSALAPGTLVLGMGREHLELLAELAPEVPGFLLSRTVGARSDIEDPMFDGRFEQRLGEVARCVDALVLELGTVG